MVALAPNTSEPSPWDVLDTFPKQHSRAREAKTPSCTEVPHSKSLDRVEIWLLIYEGCVGLESFTRDPIGFDGGGHGVYEYCRGFPTRAVDPSGYLWVMCYPFWMFSHCQLETSCTPGRQLIPGYGYTTVTCNPVGKSSDCSRGLYQLDGKCPKNCCNATDREILRCLQEFPYNAGTGDWGGNCQANTAHRLAKCCMVTSWTPEPWGFPSESGTNPHCLEWGTEIKYTCNQGGCFSYPVRVCKRRLPDSYYDQNIGCLKGHTKKQMYCGDYGNCVWVDVFVCDVFDIWQPPGPFHG